MGQMKQTTGDKVSQANICSKDESKLTEITIKDLKPSEVSKNSIIWLKTIVEPVVTSSLGVLVEDKNGECFQLALYNQVSDDLKYEDALK